MKIIMTMAGRGKRFSDAGYGLPKILIDVCGKPMFAWALESFKGVGYEDFIFICLEEHCKRFGLDANIMARTGGKGAVIKLPYPTRGQAETALFAEGNVKKDETIIIFNSDSFFKSGLIEIVKGKKNKFAGIITLFKSSDPALSYAKVEGGRITEVAEKRVISEYATVGAYCFSSWGIFSQYAKEAIRRNKKANNEFYVAPLYQEMIADGRTILPDFAESFVDLGTPEKLRRFTSEKTVCRNSDLLKRV